MLRKIRLTFAIFFFVLITLLFLDFTGTLHAWFGWMAKIQFLPALLALNVGVVIILIALTAHAHGPEPATGGCAGRRAAGRGGAGGRRAGSVHGGGKGAAAAFLRKK